MKLQLPVRPLPRAGFAVFITAAALVVRLAFTPLVNDQLPLAGFFVAVAITTLVAGPRAAWLSAALGAAAARWFFLPPAHAFSLSSGPVLFGLVGYAVVCAGLIALGAAAAKARARALVSADEAARRAHDLEAEVERRTAAEQALREREQVLLDLLDGSPASVVFLKDLEGRYLTVNKRLEQLIGTPREALCGKTDHDLFPKEVADAYRANDRAVVASGEAMVLEERVALVDGGHVFLTSKFPLRDAKGRIYGVGAIAHDITDRKRAEEALAESERRLRLLGDQIPNGALYQHLQRPDGSITYPYMSAGIERLLGLAAGAAMADSAALRARIVEEDRARVAAAEAQSARDLTPFDSEYRFHAMTGELRWVHCRSTPRRLDDGSTLWEGLAVDVTEGKKAEQALRRGEAKLRAVFNALAEGVLVLDLDGKVTDFNESVVRRFGHAAHELGDPALDPRFHAIRPDGSRFPVEELPAIVALRTGAITRDAELGVVRPDGTINWRLVNAQPVFDDTGTLLGAVASFFDITDRKQVEQALQDADKHRTEFLAMLSHELRNPLAPIRNSVYLLERAAPGGDQARRALATIDRQVTHLTRLIDDLLDVTRITRGKMLLQAERLDFGDLLRRTVEDHRTVFAANGVALQVSAPEDAQLVVRGDWARLAQVVGNLLSNSAKFCPHGGRTTVALRREGAEALLRVRDDGRGIAPEVLAKLFQPFVQADATLDRGMGGLGLGLALVKGIVEMHGGTVSAESPGVGKGSEFVVRIPVEQQLPAGAGVAAEGAAPAAALAAGPQPPLARRVLVIDDNVDAADSLRDVLEMDGHLVEVANHAHEGLLAALKTQPEVILCDIGLPGMNGYEFAQAVRADPSLRATFLVALTGYASHEDVARAKEAGFDRHLAKPPDIDDIARALAAAPRRAAAAANGA